MAALWPVRAGKRGTGRSLVVEGYPSAFAASGGGILQIVAVVQDGVLAKLLLDARRGFLDFMFLLQFAASFLHLYEGETDGAHREMRPVRFSQ